MKTIPWCCFQYHSSFHVSVPVCLSQSSCFFVNEYWSRRWLDNTFHVTFPVRKRSQFSFKYRNSLVKGLPSSLSLASSRKYFSRSVTPFKMSLIPALLPSERSCSSIMVLFIRCYNLTKRLWTPLRRKRLHATAYEFVINAVVSSVHFVLFELNTVHINVGIWT